MQSLQAVDFDCLDLIISTDTSCTPGAWQAEVNSSLTLDSRTLILDRCIWGSEIFLKSR
jgi:hypothetical protein